MSQALIASLVLVVGLTQASAARAAQPVPKRLCRKIAALLENAQGPVDENAPRRHLGSRPQPSPTDTSTDDAPSASSTAFSRRSWGQWQRLDLCRQALHHLESAQREYAAAFSTQGLWWDMARAQSCIAALDSPRRRAPHVAAMVTALSKTSGGLYHPSDQRAALRAVGRSARDELIELSRQAGAPEQVPTQTLTADLTRERVVLALRWIPLLSEQGDSHHDDLDADLRDLISTLALAAHDASLSASLDGLVRESLLLMSRAEVQSCPPSQLVPAESGAKLVTLLGPADARYPRSSRETLLRLLWLDTSPVAAAAWLEAEALLKDHRGSEQLGTGPGDSYRAGFRLLELSATRARGGRLLLKLGRSAAEELAQLLLLQSSSRGRLAIVPTLGRYLGRARWLLREAEAAALRLQRHGLLPDWDSSALYTAADLTGNCKPQLQASLAEASRLELLKLLEQRESFYGSVISELCHLRRGDEALTLADELTGALSAPPQSGWLWVKRAECERDLEREDDALRSVQAGLRAVRRRLIEGDVVTEGDGDLCAQLYALRPEALRDHFSLIRNYVLLLRQLEEWTGREFLRGEVATQLAAASREPFSDCLEELSGKLVNPVLGAPQRTKESK